MPERLRIAVAGFQHETNTFAPGRADIAAFRMADSWPPLLEGEAVITETRGMNLPIAGAISEAERAQTCEVIPILWCAAEPCGPVTDEAFDWISDKIMDGVRDAGDIDALYLDLHGAMVTESAFDGEAELLARLRQTFGPDLPIGVSLDLHANISDSFTRTATVTTVYRSYPHLDMGQTGARCMAELLAHLGGRAHHVAFRQAPFLIPLHAQSTDAAPCYQLYRDVAKLDTGSGAYVELALGFPAADIPDAGPSVLAYAPTKDEAERLAEAMFETLMASEPVFDVSLFEPADAVQQAKRHAGRKPVVLADVQDNPGGGGTSDTTGLLRAMLEGGATDAVIGIIYDPTLARLAAAKGQGALFEGVIGEGSGFAGDDPLSARFRVLSLSDGNVRYTGEMYGGGVATLGPSACLAIETDTANVKVIVSSVRVQCLDQALFTHFGVDLAACRIIALKSTIHFRADFAPLSETILSVGSLGALPCRLEGVHYAHLRPGMRKGPCGPCHEGKSAE